MEKRAKKGRGWHGDSAGHSKAARQRGKKQSSNVNDAGNLNGPSGEHNSSEA